MCFSLIFLFKPQYIKLIMTYVNCNGRNYRHYHSQRSQCNGRKYESPYKEIKGYHKTNIQIKIYHTSGYCAKADYENPFCRDKIFNKHNSLHIILMIKIIAVKTKECHGISNHQKLSSLFNSLFMPTTTNFQSSALLSLCEGNPP